MAVATHLQQRLSWFDDFARKITLLTEIEKPEQDLCVGRISQTAL